MYVFYFNKLSGPQESCETSQLSDDTVAGGSLKLLITGVDNELDVSCHFSSSKDSAPVRITQVGVLTLT